MGRPSKYPPEFRREAVELVRTSGRPRAEIARSLGISENTLANWVVADRERRERDRDPEALTESERVELRRLRRENAQLQMDMEILRKAAADSDGQCNTCSRTVAGVRYPRALRGRVLSLSATASRSACVS